MADLLDKKTGAETKAPAAPEKQRLDLRPQLRQPPAPKIYRWIQWMALFVVMAVAAVLAAVFLGGRGQDTIAYDRGAEHGEFTAMAVQDLTGVDLSVRYAGLDANLDPAYELQPGVHTLMPATWGIVNIERFAGLDANLDPDVILGSGYHTLMPATWGIINVERFAGLDADLDPDFATGAPDALGRFLDRQPAPAPDALARYLER